MVTLPETNSLPLKINLWKMKFPFVEAYFQALCQFQGGLIYLVPNGGLGCAKHDQGAIMQRMMGVAALPCVWRTFAFGMHQMIDVWKVEGLQPDLGCDALKHFA